jgi:tRNA(Ile2)-agmatinylcytidine synthase
VRSSGQLSQASGTGRGLIGATSAVAWPGDPHTWELLAYRSRERWGTPREVEVASVRAMEDEVPTTFDSFDEKSRTVTMVPSSPCPVLLGIRGTEPGDLPGALDMIEGERPEGWMVFRTNQGTDDHLVVRELAEALPYENVVVRGTVQQGLATISGGHVIFPLEEDGVRLDVAAYEPTKGFRTVVRQLRDGDRVVACGSVREEPRTLNLEKLKVLSFGEPVEHIKVANPKCPECGKGMKSVGTEAGYRCPKCGARAGENEATYEERRRTLDLGWHEVPTSARRHLARPLKLGVRPELDGIDS